MILTKNMEYRRRNVAAERHRILFVEEDDCPRHFQLIIFALAVIYGLVRIYLIFC